MSESVVPDLGHRRRPLRGRDPHQPHRAATPLELLYDLVFVVAFGQAVAMGASCEPPAGEPDIPTVARALRDRGTDTFVIVEQDMYPVDFDKPRPIAERTRAYLIEQGIS